jgi:hypothetical protein
MESPIADPSAVKFTEAFYDSIAAGKDAEFSYRQGVHALRLANDPNYAVPVLLHQGETWRPPQSLAVPPAASREIEQPETDRETIIGVALDVSGSMEGSFDNRSTDMSSRLETVRASLGRKLDARTLRAASAQAPPVRIFCYAFGLRDGGACDLFSMLKAAEDVINREEIDRLADQYARELRAEYSSGGVGDLGSLAKSFGLGSLMKAAEEIGRNQVKQRVTAEVERRLRARMRGMGDTTLTLEEFAGFWKGSSGSLADAEPLIYGNTPMCQALRDTRDRFKREFVQVQGTDRAALLLLISDGEPSDGDPEPIAAEIRKLGVSIVSCYLTSSDLASPRRLVAEPGRDWPAGAIRLFDMASKLDLDSELSRYLLRQGWYVEPDAACLVQVNHSEVLDEFVGLATSPALAGRELLPKGR